MALARIAAAIFLTGTFLANSRTGEHYLVDLVVGLPLSLAVYAACMPIRPEYRWRRSDAMIGGILMLSAW